MSEPPQTSLASAYSPIHVGIAGVSLLTVGLFINLWIKYASSRWVTRLHNFRNEHHKFCTASSPQEKIDVLLVVNPASGGGKPMLIYQDCLDELKRQGHEVEVYVTKDSQDMIALSEKVDLSRYTQKIIFLAGDSSLFEFVQAPLQKNNGYWPYAPILILPGGSGNALSSEFHFRSNDPVEILQKAVQVKKGTIIKVSSSCNGTTRYALHNAFDGYQRRLIDALESKRGTLYAAFGKPAILLTIIYTIFSFISYSANDLKPVLFCVMTSDIEGMGGNLNFGIGRFDGKMSVMHQEKFKGVMNLVHAIGKTVGGVLGKEFQEGIVSDKDLYTDVRKNLVLDAGGHYRLYMDGSNNLPVEGDRIIFEALPNAVPYLVM